MWERGDKTNQGIPELNASSIGMAKVRIHTHTGRRGYDEGNSLCRIVVCMGKPIKMTDTAEKACHKQITFIKL